MHAFIYRFISINPAFIKKKEKKAKRAMPPVPLPMREEIANRLMGGQTPKGISKDLGISLKTIYRLKGKFQQEDGTYLALPAEVASTRAFSRECGQRDQCLL